MTTIETAQPTATLATASTALMPQRMLSEGQLADHYFAGKTRPGESQTLVGKHEGRICRLHPTTTSLEALCERHGCSDPTFAEFIKNLLQVGIASVL